MRSMLSECDIDREDSPSIFECMQSVMASRFYIGVYAWKQETEAQIRGLYMISLLQSSLLFS